MTRGPVVIACDIPPCRARLEYDFTTKTMATQQAKRLHWSIRRGQPTMCPAHAYRNAPAAPSPTRSLNASPRPRTTFDKGTADQMAREYEAGATLTELADRHGGSTSSVRAAVYRAGVDMRRPGRRKAER